MTIHVNGINLYYEKVGQGPPLVLLHCNSMTHAIFHTAMRQFAAHYTVYALDSRDHGKSQRVRELHYTDMVEDVAGFVKTLDIKAPMLYGFSDGGIIGLVLAYTHPDLLSRLIVSGASLNPESTKDSMLRFDRLMYAVTRGRKWKLMLKEPRITESELSRITVPALVLAGGRDMIKEGHTRRIAGAIPGARLQILPGESHMSYIVYSRKLYRIIRPFLEEQVY